MLPLAVTYPFSSPEAMFDMVSTKNRNLWVSTTPEVCNSQTSHQIWEYETNTLPMLRKSVPAWGQDSWYWSKRVQSLGMARSPTKVVNQPKQPINSINVSIAQYKLTTGQSCHDKQTKLSINQGVNQSKLSINQSCQSNQVFNHATTFSLLKWSCIQVVHHATKVVHHFILSINPNCPSPSQPSRLTGTQW